jgi:hypothetical protein
LTVSSSSAGVALSEGRTHHEPCRARAACIDRLDRRLQPRAIASGDQHIGTLGGNRFRDAEAQPAR